MNTGDSQFVVQLERCILRASTPDDYKALLECSGDTNKAHFSLLQAIEEQCAELHLGQKIFANDTIPASVTVVDLVPATTGRLCETTTLVVFPPSDKSDVEDSSSALHMAKETFDDDNNNEVCVVVLDYSLTGSFAVASRAFFLQTLAVDGSVMCVGDEEYRTAFVVNTAREGLAVDSDAPLLCTSPDVFRNIRAALFLDPMSTVMAAGAKYSAQKLFVPFYLFQTQRDEATFFPTTIGTKNDTCALQLSSVCFVPAWPKFVLVAFFGERYEELLNLALHASKADLHGRIISEGDVVVLCIAPHFFVERQLPCLDAAEVLLTHVAHCVQSGHAMTSMRPLLRDGVIVIPLRVAEVVSLSSGKFYGVLDLSGDSTQVFLSLSNTAAIPADTTPLFPPPRSLPAFYSQLSLAMNIRNVLNLFFSFSQFSQTCLFVVHAMPENMPYECLLTVFLENGVECLIIDLDRWSDEELEGLISEYVRSIGEVVLIIRNAQSLPDRPWVLQLFDEKEIASTKLFGVRLIFLVFESIEEPPPVVSARACNVQGVLKGTTLSDDDRRIILESQFCEAERLFGICKSLLLSFDLMASWTVGLTAADIVAYMQECVCALTSMCLADGVRPVLSEALCESVLQKYQKAHGCSIVSTRLRAVRWDDVGGLVEAKRELMEMIQLPLLHPALFSSGAKRRAGILFYGPPGCGKTLLARAVATEMNMNFMAVKGPELINQYVGESEKNIRQLFQRARDNSPCIIFFDELDALAPARGAKGDAGGAMDRVVAQLLVEVDGVGHKRTDGTDGGNVFIIGATNRPDLLDPSLLRPGRFDRLCYLGVPSTREEQLAAVVALTRNFHLSDDVDFEALLQPLSFEYTGADFFALCSDAMMFAVESLMRGDDGEQPPHLVVHMCDFVRARDQLRPSVSSEDLQRYEAMRRNFLK